MTLTEEKIAEIEKLAGKHSVLYWPEVLELIARARELDEVRRVLAGTDAASLPNDMSVVRMAHLRMKALAFAASGEVKVFGPEDYGPGQAWRPAPGKTT